MLGVMNKGKPDMPGSSKSFQSALSFLDLVKMTGASAEATDSAPGFSALVNQHLMAPAPPRAIKVMDWDSSCAYFRKLLLDSVQALTVDQVER